MSPMKRSLLIAGFLAAFYASIALGDGSRPANALATTGFIAKIDAKNSLLKVRESERSIATHPSQTRNTERRPGISLPGGFGIHLPGTFGNDAASSDSSSVAPEEYTVTITPSTVLRDGDQSVKLADFRVGERISIHGTMTGTNLVATQVSKWSD